MRRRELRGLGLNVGEHAGDLVRVSAFDLLAAHEGSALANTMRDPTVSSGPARRIDRWIDTL